MKATIKVTMPRLLSALLLLIAACTTSVLFTAPAPAGERDPSLQDSAAAREPPVFRDANGGAFRPRSIIIAGPRGAMAARVPENTRQTRGENRVNLSGTPVVGPLFRGTLDVATARRAPLIGTVYRAGNNLVIQTVEAPPSLDGRPVAIATNVPRLGAVSFQLGPLDWHPVPPPSAPRTEIGTAHLLDGDLVLASRGGEPAFPSVQSLFRGLF